MIFRAVQPTRPYNDAMNKLLEDAIAKVQTLPSDRQEQAARMLLAYVGDEDPVYELTPEDWVDLAEAEAEFRRGEFASDTEVRAVWAKHGL